MLCLFYSANIFLLSFISIIGLYFHIWPFSVSYVSLDVSWSRHERNTFPKNMYFRNRNEFLAFVFPPSGFSPQRSVLFVLHRVSTNPFTVVIVKLHPTLRQTPHLLFYISIQGTTNTVKLQARENGLKGHKEGPQGTGGVIPERARQPTSKHIRFALWRRAPCQFFDNGLPSPNSQAHGGQVWKIHINFSNSNFSFGRPPTWLSRGKVPASRCKWPRGFRSALKRLFHAVVDHCDDRFMQQVQGRGYVSWYIFLLH